MIEGVVFDLDGLMIDSEPFSWKAWNRLLEPFGTSLEYADFQAIIGIDSQASARHVAEVSQIEMTAEAIVAGHERLRLEIVRAEAEPMDGLAALVAELGSRGLPMAVASNSPSDYVQVALEAIGMQGEFVAAIGFDDVENGKPAPDLYLRAASLLGVGPGSCLVFEDSPAGLASAIAAGMRCVAVPSHDLLQADFSPAYARYDSLIDVLENLEDLLE